MQFIKPVQAGEAPAQNLSQDQSQQILDPKQQDLKELEQSVLPFDPKSQVGKEALEPTSRSQDSVVTDQVDVGKDTGGESSSDASPSSDTPLPGDAKDTTASSLEQDVLPPSQPTGLEAWFNGLTGLDWSQGEIFQALGVLVLGLLVLFVVLRGPRRVAGEMAIRREQLRTSMGLNSQAGLDKQKPPQKGEAAEARQKPIAKDQTVFQKPEELSEAAAEEQPHRIRESIADRLISDRPLRPGDPDPLGYGAIARGISRFLRNKKTEPPLTLAIEGPWGSGKSSIMSLLKHDLERYGYHPVWFNAWHQTKEEHLLAALLESLRLEGFPPFWTRAGQGFRVRLFLRRLARHPGMVVTFVALLALQVGVMLAGFFLDAEDVKQVTGDWALLEERLASILPVTLAALVAAYNLFKALPNSLIDPAKLRAGLTRGFSVNRYREQLSFRHRFAEEFQDVAAAMAPLRPVILIDDLDRCQPPEVLEVLTAVNFLVSSGACFAILGMDRERVLGCLGYGFKDIAEEMAADEESPLDQAFQGMSELFHPPTETPRKSGKHSSAAASMVAELVQATQTGQASIGPDPDGQSVEAVSQTASAPRNSPTETEPAEGEARAKKHRIAYARLYLEKLINIEVPVPQLGVADAQKLLQSVAKERSDKTADPVRKTGFPPLKVLAAIAAVCLAMAFGGTLALLDHTIVETSGASTEQVDDPLKQGAKGSGANTGLGTADGNEDTSDGFNFVLPVLIIVGFAALGLAMAQLSRDYTRTLSKQQAQIADSQRFLAALNLWSPLLVQKLTTPRALKRFLNRLRYLAMLNRGEEGEKAGEAKLREDRLVAYAALNMVADDDLPLALARQKLVAAESVQDHPQVLLNSSKLGLDSEALELPAFLRHSQREAGGPDVPSLSEPPAGAKSRRAALLEGVGRLDNLKQLAALQDLEGYSDATALGQMVSRHEAQFEGELLVPEDVERFNAMAKGTLQ